MNIVIFEDTPPHRVFIEETVKEHIAKERLKISIELVTDSVPEVERYIERSQAYTLYFIDIMDGQGNPSGLTLSEKIKQKNSADTIIFITGYLKKILYSTEHKILALNIVHKNNKTAKKEICASIEHAYSKMAGDDCLILDNPNGDTFKAAYKDIYMIETVKGCHRIRIYYGIGVYECVGLLKEIIPKLDGRFKRCHKSYIVNLDKIEQVSKKEHEIVLTNGVKANYAPRYKIEGAF